MNQSDTILNSPICLARCKQLNPNDWEELFQVSWLKMRERELAGAKIIDPVSYFYIIALNESPRRKTNNKQKGVRMLELKHVRTKHTAPVDEPIKLDWMNEDIVKEFMACDFEGDEVRGHYQNQLKLIMECGSVPKALKQTGLKKTAFYDSLNGLRAALKEIRNGHFE
jgi:hypothetical protein